tara:strand:- start:1138 stop:1461 length:324 start_codon:yes stop_codon:yes gene_type:complete
MTSLSIEKATRAILKMDGSRSERDIDNMRDAQSLIYKYTVAEATLVRAFTIEEAAKRIEQRRDDYIREHGSFDPETGIIELPGTGDEHVGELEEIAEDLRGLLTESE